VQRLLVGSEKLVRRVVAAAKATTGVMQLYEGKVGNFVKQYARSLCIRTYVRRLGARGVCIALDVFLAYNYADV
jgi:hypothetical protein